MSEILSRWLKMHSPHQAGPKSTKRNQIFQTEPLPGFAAHEILSSLQPHLAASTGSACTSGIEEPSHVLQAIGLDHDDAMATIRFSVGFDTTENDVHEAIDLIDRTLLKLSNIGLMHSA